MKISRRFHFAAAHRLPFHNGLCKNLHGHTYFLEVILKKFYFNDDVLLDFLEFDSIVNYVIVSK